MYKYIQYIKHIYTIYIYTNIIYIYIYIYTHKERDTQKVSKIRELLNIH